MTVLPMEEVDRFSRYLEGVLRDIDDDDAGFVDLEYIGFGILRVKFKSGTRVVVIVSPVDDDDTEECAP